MKDLSSKDVCFSPRENSRKLTKKKRTPRLREDLIKTLGENDEDNRERSSAEKQRSVTLLREAELETGTTTKHRRTIYRPSDTEEIHQV